MPTFRRNPNILADCLQRFDFWYTLHLSLTCDLCALAIYPRLRESTFIYNVRGITVSCHKGEVCWRSGLEDYSLGSLEDQRMREFMEGEVYGCKGLWIYSMARFVTHRS
jgi:hypothetical protein